MNIREVIKFFTVTKEGKNTYQCKCPAHDDKQSSLTVSEGKNGNILLHCHANCSTELILSRVGLSLKDLFPANENKNSINDYKKQNKDIEKPEIKKQQTTANKFVAQYDYYNENNVLSHSTLRYLDEQGGKIFKQCSYKDGKKVWSLKDCEIFLYRLPELLEDIAQDREIFIVEGEKDVDNLRSIGVPATTSPMGAGKWRDSFNQYFKDSNIVIIPDNDEPGLNHAELIADNLKDIAFSVKILKLPYLPHKGDVTDFLNTGNSAKDLYSLTANTQTIDHANKVEASIKEENELNKIRSEIYSDDDKPVLLLQNVLDVLARKYKLCTSEIKGKRKYFIYQKGYWKETSQDKIGQLFSEWLTLKTCTPRNINTIVDLMSKFFRFDVDESLFDSKANYVNLNNGAFNLDTYKLEPHKPEHYFTYKADYDYIPNASCPIFDENLHLYSSKQSDWVKAFWEITGYCLRGDYPFQKMFWFTGSKGRNGKGTCIRVIETLVGDKFTVSDIDTRDLREKFYKTRLIGKRLATAGDLHNRLANVATLKQLTGGDRQTTDVKFGDAMSFTSTAKIIFAMNQLPELPPNENIAPVAKRIVILPFEHVILKPDTTIEAKFMMEISGIFNRAIEGLKRLTQQREFTEVERGQRLLDMYAKKEPVFENFVSDNLMYKDCKGGMFLYDIWEMYQTYMNQIFGGEHWKYDKDQPIKSSFTLSDNLRKYYDDREQSIIIEKRATNGKKGTHTFYRNILAIDYYDNINQF